MSKVKTVFIIIFCLITVSCFSQRKTNHITISRHNSECIIDENNIELIPSRHYSDIWTTYDTGKYFVVTGFNGKEGIYELSKKEIVPCIYDDIKMFGNHGFVTKGKNWAVFSRNFKEVSGFIFEDASHFNEEGIALVKQNTQWVLIDTNAAIVNRLPYDEVFQFNEDDVFKKAGNNKKYGFIDRNYKIIIPFEYEDVGVAVNNINDVFPVKKGGKWGYVNKQNHVIVPFKYAYVTPIYKGFGWIRDNNFKTIGLVDSKGKVLFDDSRYVDVEYAEEGKFIYTIKNSITGKYMRGYLDSTSFQVLVEPQFESCEHFNNGLAVVKKNGLSALIGTSGNIVLPYKYEYISRWGNNYFATLKGKTGMTDKSGKIIVPLEFENCSYGGSYATITKAGLKGILDISGKVLVAPKYDDVKAISEKVFYGIKGNKKFLIYQNGSEKEIE